MRGIVVVRGREGRLVLVAVMRRGLG